MLPLPFVGNKKGLLISAPNYLTRIHNELKLTNTELSTLPNLLIESLHWHVCLAVAIPLRAINRGPV